MSRNYRVVLKGVAFTEVDMVANSEGEAMRLAEEWARGKTSADELNHVDFDGHSWAAFEAGS